MLKNGKLPIYSKQKCSDDFYVNFAHSGTRASVTCICGRTHFTDDFPLDEPEDEQEKERLEKLAEEQPDAYILHEANVSFFDSNDQTIVFDCACNYAGKMENLIVEHRRSIINYFKSTAAVAQQKADRATKEIVEL